MLAQGGRDSHLLRSFRRYRAFALLGYGPKMTNKRSRSAAILLAFVVTLLGGLGLSAPAFAAPVTGTAVEVQAAECGDTSDFTKTPLGDLPPEASETYDLINEGGPFPYPDKDGTVFSNREGILPDCDEGYYHEYTVPTPGSDDRGARRIVTGDADEFFYTDDHYESFVLIDAAGDGTPDPDPKPECGDVAGLDSVNLSDLPAAAADVVAEVQGGATGTTYENREAALPACDAGYYQLFEVGTEDRIVSGEGGEIFYTADHYKTFQAVDVDA